MLFRLLSIALVSLAGAAPAEPRYVDVEGVASNDSLNVRTGPGSGFSDIGDIPPFATGIEVLETRDGWGRILWQEGNGWIALRFTKAAARPTIRGSAIPIGLQCGGTEPFWSTRLGGNGITFSEPGGTALALNLVQGQTAEGHRFPHAFSFASASAAMLTIIRPAECSDGMSDRSYGWSVDAIAPDRRLLTGCCHLPLDAGQN